jgi:hypothetical protein
VYLFQVKPHPRAQERVADARRLHRDASSDHCLA